MDMVAVSSDLVTKSDVIEVVGTKNHIYYNPELFPKNDNNILEEKQVTRSWLKRILIFLGLIVNYLKK
jgi:hypothetical protein